MKNYDKEIEKHEKKIQQLKTEQQKARELPQSKIDEIYAAFDMGFNVNHVSQAMHIEKRLVRLIQKRRATTKRQQTGVTRTYNKEESKWKLIQTRGTPEWAEHIRRGHQGELPTRTLVPRCQEVHDSEGICPFCFKNQFKSVNVEIGQFPNNAEGWKAYIKWNGKRQFKQNLNDFPEGRFPNYVKKQDRSAIGSVETTFEGKGVLPPDVQVQVNGHNLTDDEFEAMDRTDEEISNDANQLLAEDELIQQSENKGLLTKIKNKIQNPHHSAIQRRRNSKDLEKKASELDSATLKRLATMKEAEEARTKGKEDDQ